MYGPSNYHWWMLIFRGFFNVLDTGVYLLISAIYQVFFNVSNATILSGETTKALFTRVQLILGIFILFKLALSLINGVINPDSISDKSNGFDKIVRRIIVALVMLVLVIPLNIPGGGSTSYEKQINNNGILFGTLYEFQNRVLSENTLARLILSRPITTTDEDDRNKLSDFGDTLSAIILKTFITPNLKDEETEKLINSGDDYANSEYLACGEDAVDKVKEYQESGSIRYILDLTGDHCSKKFTFNYTMIISTAVGVLFLIIMIGFTLDIAIRSFKLLILRLIALIPILSYIDQKNDNGAFSTWVKTVTSTYLDLFLRVAIVLFIVFIINEFYNTGIVMDVSSGLVGMFSWLFIILGLFYFARQAPKFILDSLGIKSEFNIFGGVSAMLGLGAVGLSRARTGFRASQTATDRNDEMNDTQTNKAVRLMKALAAGGVGLVTGGVTGAVETGTGKDRALSNALKNSRARNREILANADLGSTWWARTKNDFSENVLGDSDYHRKKRQEEELKRQLEDAKGISTLFSNIHSMAEEKAVLSDKTFATKIGDNEFIGSNGKAIRFNYASFTAQMDAQARAGRTDALYVDDTGNSYYFASIADARNAGFLSQMKDANTSDYLAHVDADDGVISDAGVKNYLDYANSNVDDFRKMSHTSEDILGSVKTMKGQSKSKEFDINNKLSKVQEELPKARANTRDNQ